MAELAAPSPIVLRHDGGARRRVVLLGFFGVPLRPRIHWPLAGDYVVSLVDGSLVGDASDAESVRQWSVSGYMLRKLRRERAALELAAQVAVW